MNKIKIRIIVVLLSLLFLGGSYFAVLLKEEEKRQSDRGAMAAELQGNLTDTERRREEYFLAVEAKKAELKKAMEDAKAAYDALLQQQPALIDANKKGVSVPVEKTVQVQVPVTTPTAPAPTATRKTKTS